MLQAIGQYLPPRPGKGVRLDRLDLKILSALQTDGRITNLKLADMVGLSATPCLQRVRRLEAAGYIRAYGAELDAERLFDHVVVHSQVVLASQRQADVTRFERFVMAEPRIVECARIAGESDYLLKSVACDLADHQHLVDALLGESVGAARLTCLVATRNVKQSRVFPLECMRGSLELAVRQ
jgi:Lrp/AsnC family transcriptional regulator of ectoine degradation